MTHEEKVNWLAGFAIGMLTMILIWAIVAQFEIKLVSEYFEDGSGVIRLSYCLLNGICS